MILGSPYIILNNIFFFSVLAVRLPYNTIVFSLSVLNNLYNYRVIKYNERF